ncbi:metallophosphoesterase 1 isoform X2 [Neodiprion fabricii]|uniref:metallophosphoesterase 1 isoform X2 n=1 Tax=Neodiprion fabricii TaxID=2872261 RepID=UPI001ED925B2|nr:metallophosphoesterase 1 isoform X2 [Neodiprion fabricii]
MDGCDISLRYLRLGYLKLETINELQSLYTQGILRPGYLVFLLRVRRSLSRNFSMWVARSGRPKSRSSYSAEQCRRAACESDVFIRYSLVGIQKRSLVRQVKKGFLLSRILMFVREWQMYRAFQTAMTIHKPELVFILGDIFDEGLWCSSAEFDRYVARFNSLFYIPQNTQLYVVAGNHDMGFHYKIIPYLNQRFVNAMNAPSVKRVSVRGNHFVLMNSMALEGDGCFLCKPTEMALNRIAKQLKCTKGIGSSCKSKDILKQYSKPILLQHYPMYRESDEICHEVDEAPANIKSEKFRERWECLSKEASEQVPFRHNGTETYSQWSHASWLQANSPRKYPRIHRSVFQLAQQKQSVVFTRCIHAEQLLGIKVLHACRNDGHRNIYNRFYSSIPLPLAQS